MLKKRATACAAFALLLLAACGGEDEPTDSGRTESTPTVTETDREATRTGGEETVGAREPTRTIGPEEAEPGGPGDEEPAASQARFTGRDGRIGPRRVFVPPFIAIRVELRSADGRDYGLRFGRERVGSGDSVLLGGLRPGKRAVGEPVSQGNRVVIEASAEPGP